jgi:NDP-sugar pyrophosphorylase family protein
MKTIYLWVSGDGWMAFDFDAEKTKEALAERNIKIGDYAEIGYNAKIGDNAEIGDYAEIGYNAEIGYYAKIGYNAKIGDNAKIGYYAKIGYNAKIGDREIILNTLFITGSKHTVTWWGKDIINIGCYKKEIAWWLEHGIDVAKREGYSDAQIAEYRQYVEMCDNLQRTTIIELNEIKDEA